MPGPESVTFVAFQGFRGRLPASGPEDTSTDTNDGAVGSTPRRGTDLGRTSASSGQQRATAPETGEASGGGGRAGRTNASGVFRRFPARTGSTALEEHLPGSPPPADGSIGIAREAA